MASKVEDGEKPEDFLAEQGKLFGQGFSFSGYERDLLALGSGDGRFVDASGVSGIDSVGDGRAAVRADFDDDGDVDVFLRAMHGPAHLLFRNEVGSELGGWLRIELRGRESGTDAFGALVRVASGGRVQAQVVDGGSGFLSQADRRLLFGLGLAKQADSVEVVWPSGRVQRFTELPARTSWRLVEGAEELTPVIERSSRLGGRGPRWPALPGLVAGARLPSLGLPAGPVKERIATPDGRPLLVSFFATWCRTCRAELPALQDVAARSGVRLVAVSVDNDEDAARVPTFLDGLGWTGESSRASEAAARQLFGEKVSLPALVLLDGSNRQVLDATVGASRAGWTRLVDAAKKETR